MYINIFFNFYCYLKYVVLNSIDFFFYLLDTQVIKRYISNHKYKFLCKTQVLSSLHSLIGKL